MFEADEITKAGGPACTWAMPAHFHEAWEGMTLRDYFAGQYMTSALERGSRLPQYELENLFGDLGGLTREEIGAVLAYRYADAMLAARQKRR